MSLELDIINISIIVDLLNQYADTVKHECRIQNRQNLLNKTRSIQDKANWYLSQLKSDITSEHARALDDVIKKADTLDFLLFFNYVIMLDEDKRNDLQQLLFAMVKNNKKIEIKIHDK